MCAFGGDQQLRYSPYVRPLLLDGVRCVVVDPALAKVEPRAFRFLIDFASDNALVVIDPDASAAGNDSLGWCPLPDNPLEKLVGERRVLPERE